MNYLLGSIWLLCLFFLFFIVGSAFNQEMLCGPAKILVGYIVYSFGIALAGIIVQIFNLEYNLFRILMWTWIAVLVIISLILFCRKTGRGKLNGWSLIGFIKKYWALIAIIVTVIFLDVINYPALWLGNHLDDGFYLAKITSYPEVSKPFEYNVATGFYTGHVIDAYSLNTHELEASVYFQLLRIPIGIFARIFLAMENIGIFACCIYSFSTAIFSNQKSWIKYQNIIQFIPCVLFLFSANSTYLSTKGILDVQDSWQTTTAMYFGSSIVRTSGFFLLLFPFVKQFELNWRIFLEVALISVVLISKSTIALPIIFVASISYIVIWSWSEPKSVKFLIGIFLICIGLVGVLVPNFLHLDQFGFDSLETINSNIDIWLEKLLRSFVPYLCLPGTVAAIYAKKVRLIGLEGLIFVFLFLPGFRIYTAALSMYSFVIGRVISAFTYFLISTMIALIVYGLTLFRIRRSLLVGIGLLGSITLAGINLESFLECGGNPLALQGSEITSASLRKALAVLQMNPDLMPVVTQNFANALNKLGLERGKFAVLTETYYESNGVMNSQYVMTKCLAPNVIFPTANIRYYSGEDPIYGSYNAEKQAIFESFLTNNDENSTKAFGELLEAYNIDAVLLPNNSVYDVNMNQLGFSLYETIYSDDGQVANLLYARQ